MLSDLGLSACSSDTRYYLADQTCALGWVLVVGASQTLELPEEEGEEGEGVGCTETVYYYRNRVTGETAWGPPVNWGDLVAGWEGWTLCCSEEQSDDLYW